MCSGSGDGRSAASRPWRRAYSSSLIRQPPPVTATVGLVSGFHPSGQIQLVKQPDHRETSVALAIGRRHPLRIPSDAFGQLDGADIALVRYSSRASRMASSKRAVARRPTVSGLGIGGF